MSDEEPRVELKPLHEDMDAQRWAREFKEHLTGMNYVEVDDGWLVGWFSNAIMCGYDTANRRSLEQQAGWIAVGERLPVKEHEKSARIVAAYCAANDYINALLGTEIRGQSLQKIAQHYWQKVREV